MTAPPDTPTLSDIAKSIASLEEKMATKVDVTASIDRMESTIARLEANMVTKEEFTTSIARLESTITREAGDLGESIASLTNMVAAEFNGVDTRLDRLEAGQRHANRRLDGLESDGLRPGPMSGWRIWKARSKP